jgi:hypothetical protein
VSAQQQQAFRLAAGELGMATAAWLFVSQTAEVEHEAGVLALRDAMGRDWSVLDAVCAAWLAGARAGQPVVDGITRALHGLERLVLVGYEAVAVDALLADLAPDVRVGLLPGDVPRSSVERLLENHAGRLELLDLERFPGLGGAALVAARLHVRVGRHASILRAAGVASRCGPRRAPAIPRSPRLALHGPALDGVPAQTLSDERAVLHAFAARMIAVGRFRTRVRHRCPRRLVH